MSYLSWYDGCLACIFLSALHEFHAVFSHQDIIRCFHCFPFEAMQMTEVAFFQAVDQVRLPDIVLKRFDEDGRLK